MSTVSSSSAKTTYLAVALSSKSSKTEIKTETKETSAVTVLTYEEEFPALVSRPVTKTTQETKGIRYSIDDMGLESDEEESDGEDNKYCDEEVIGTWFKVSTFGEGDVTLKQVIDRIAPLKMNQEYKGIHCQPVLMVTGFDVATMFLWKCAENNMQLPSDFLKSLANLIISTNNIHCSKLQVNFGYKIGFDKITKLGCTYLDTDTLLEDLTLAELCMLTLGLIQDTCLFTKTQHKKVYCPYACPEKYPKEDLKEIYYLCSQFDIYRQATNQVLESAGIDFKDDAEKSHLVGTILKTEKKRMKKAQQKKNAKTKKKAIE